MIRLRILMVAVLTATFAAHASAQFRLQQSAPRAGSLEIGGGGLLEPSTDFGERQAEETRNPGTGTSPLDLFVSDTTLQRSVGVHAFLGYYVTRAIAIEGGVRLSQPKLRVRLTSDFEEAEPITAEETVTQYQFEGSLVMHLTNLSFGDGSGFPFLIAGAGHIRDVHQGNDLIETGNEFHGGGGVKWWFGSGRRRLGIRVEGRVTSRQGGVDFGDARRTVVSGAGSLAYVF